VGGGRNRGVRDFELAVMTGHAFQFLVDDEEVRASLAAINRGLVAGGRFAFETRNPPARAWESWTPANAIDIVDPAGRQVRVSHEVSPYSTISSLSPRQQAISAAFRCESTGQPCASSISTRSHDSSPQPASESRPDTAARSREPLDPASPEMITVARATDAATPQPA